MSLSYDPLRPKGHVYTQKDLDEAERIYFSSFVTCPKCGHRWRYLGEGKAMKCSVCSWYEADKSYMKQYRQTAEYKLWNRIRSKGVKVSIAAFREAAQNAHV